MKWVVNIENRILINCSSRKVAGTIVAEYGDYKYSNPTWLIHFLLNYVNYYESEFKDIVITHFGEFDSLKDVSIYNVSSKDSAEDLVEVLREMNKID